VGGGAASAAGGGGGEGGGARCVEQRWVGPAVASRWHACPAAKAIGGGGAHRGWRRAGGRHPPGRPPRASDHRWDVACAVAAGGGGLAIRGRARPPRRTARAAREGGVDSNIWSARLKNAAGGTVRPGGMSASRCLLCRRDPSAVLTQARLVTRADFLSPSR